MPKRIAGTPYSRRSLYRTNDIIALKNGKHFRKLHNDIELPLFERTVTRGRFESYLATAVHNHYANWCRTISRKYKDLYLDPLEDGTPWESAVSDTTNGRQEDACDLRMFYDLVGEENFRKARVLVERGYSMSDIVHKLGLKKLREEIGLRVA